MQQSQHEQHPQQQRVQRETASALASQTAHPILDLQHTVGNRSVQRLLQTERASQTRQGAQSVLALQKTVGNRAVQRMLAQKQAAPHSSRQIEAIQRDCAECQDETPLQRALDDSRVTSGSVDGVLQRQSTGGGSGAPAGCPPDFCTPYPNRLAAEAARAAMAPGLLAGIAVAVNSRVVGLWNQYIWGGSAPQNLSSQFGGDFTTSVTTADATDFLVNELRTNLESSPPTFPPGVDTVTIDIPSRIGTAIAALDTTGSGHEMDFNVIGEVPGNLAGGIGKTQLTHVVGARPSPFNDSRSAAGTADVTRNPDGTLTVVPHITFTVQDTIDLCPGNCGAPMEQLATVPLSRFEASGISGDVPFTVQYAAPPRSITITPSTPPTPPPTPPTPAGPVRGEITASRLRIRQTATTSSSILGHYTRGEIINILCQTTGENISGNSTWDQTDRGFVSDRYVNRLDPGPPPNC